ncbi:MAG: HU family DNA-binding protein [Candidatus Cloacimonetes bacterium]|nr:HU family DNA-binding protein [Candidatus Cloacimonadota bacterium]
MFGKDKWVSELRTKLGVTKEVAEDIFDTNVVIIQEALKEDTVRIPGVGVLRRNEIPAHKAKNPQDGTEVDVPARFNTRINSPTQDIV